MRFEFVTLFPELIEAATGAGLLGKALESGVLSQRTQSPRAFATDKHRSVDDTPYGGGSGMLMMPEPVVAAMEALDARAVAAGEPRSRRVLLSPQGKVFTQADARRLSGLPALMLICGRYEGIDDRVGHFVDETLSLGDFVLNGGEIAALAIVEAVGRLVKGMVGNPESLVQESHGGGLLEYPQYTRPRDFRGHAVPEELLSGNHGLIARFRRQQALLRTRSLRPDLLAQAQLHPDELAWLAAQPEPAGMVGSIAGSAKGGATDPTGRGREDGPPSDGEGPP